MILIKNGSIVIDNNLVKKDVLVDSNTIIKIEDNIDLKCDILDASGCLVMPGAVDVHVHLREPGFETKETIKTGTASCAKGGLTSIMSMPNLKPCPDSKENVLLQLELIKKDALVNVYPFGTITINEEDKELSKIDEFKDLVYGLTDDGRGVNNLSIFSFNS